CTIIDGSGCNRSLVQTRVKISAQIEIAIASWRAPGEIDGIIRRNETRHASFDRGVEQYRLRIHDYIAQPLQGRDDTGGARACLGHLEGVVQVYLGDG